MDHGEKCVRRRKMDDMMWGIVIVILVLLHLFEWIRSWKIYDKLSNFEFIVNHRLDAHSDAFDSADERAKDLFTAAAARGIAIGEFLDLEFEYENPTPGKWKAVKKTTKTTKK
jgi:hypothetical protein